MAKLTIDILNPVIDLIRNIKTTSTSCITESIFDIEGTPNGQLQVNIARMPDGTVEDYKTAEINLNGTWVTSAYSSQTHTLNSTGKAKFRLRIGNADLVTIKNGAGSCNEVRLTLTDLTTGVEEGQNFARCREGAQCGEVTPPVNSLSINSTTNIVLYFDKSGSMDTTLAPLQTMRDTLLKDALLPYYNNDESVYYNKVNIIEVTSKTAIAYEDPYGMLNYENKNLAGKVISLIFIDEADAFAPPGIIITDPSTTIHNTSLATFRNRLNNFPSGYYQGVLFQVATPDQGGNMVAFRNYIEAVKNGTGSYSGTNGLSDKSEVNIKLDITPASTPTYYKDLIIASLNELGYTL